ncbi:MAG: hypothetical protein ACR2LG_06795 [Actinomycetota bacterium]
MHSLDGNDVICAGEGNDQVDAGEGDDEIYGGPAQENLTAGPGADTPSMPEMDWIVFTRKSSRESAKRGALFAPIRAWPVAVARPSLSARVRRQPPM